jgi:hypothetical protein
MTPLSVSIPLPNNPTKLSRRGLKFVPEALLLLKFFCAVVFFCRRRKLEERNAMGKPYPAPDGLRAGDRRHHALAHPTMALYLTLMSNIDQPGVQY